MESKVRPKKILVLRNLDMFVWTSGFHNPLAHTHFNMFVDECLRKPCVACHRPGRGIIVHVGSQCILCLETEFCENDFLQMVKLCYCVWHLVCTNAFTIRNGTDGPLTKLC